MNILDQVCAASNAKFDLAELRTERNAVLNKMLSDPRNFAQTLYTSQKKGFFNRTVEIFSPYLNLDDTRFCCLTEEITPKTSTELPCTCYFSKITAIDAKKSQVNLFTVNQNFFIKVDRIKDLHITYSDEAPAKVKGSKLQIIQTCDYKMLENVQYLGSDQFTNAVLVGYILNIVYEQANNGLRGILETYGATVCQENKANAKSVLFLEYVNGHSLRKFAEIGGSEYTELNEQSITIFKKNIVIDIFKQITANLHFLWRSIYFNHGGLIASSLSVDTERATNTTYAGLKINSPFTLKMENFAHTALTLAINGNKYLRVYQRSSKISTYLKLAGFNPIVGTQLSQPYYILDSSFNTTALARVRHMGIPFYGSFDLYTVLISLLIMPEIYYTVFTDSKLKNIFFDTMWFIEDISPVFKAITNAMENKKPNSYDTVISILRGRKLKCNLLNDLLRVLQQF